MLHDGALGGYERRGWEGEVEKGGKRVGVEGGRERERRGVCLGDGRRRETSLGWGDKGALHGGNDNWVR